MYVILWEFRVREGREAAFEMAYGPDGDWARLFRRDVGYLGTELLADPDLPRRYLTIDRWVSAEAHREFSRRWKAEYEALDSTCNSLTEVETRLGAFQTSALAQPGEKPR
jgi:heme-degrading monooxygenase HmoA